MSTRTAWVKKYGPPFLKFSVLLSGVTVIGVELHTLITALTSGLSLLPPQDTYCGPEVGLSGPLAACTEACAPGIAAGRAAYPEFPSLTTLEAIYQQHFNETTGSESGVLLADIAGCAVVGRTFASDQKFFWEHVLAVGVSAIAAGCLSAFNLLRGLDWLTSQVIARCNLRETNPLVQAARWLTRPQGRIESRRVDCGRYDQRAWSLFFASANLAAVIFYAIRHHTARTKGLPAPEITPYCASEGVLTGLPAALCDEAATHGLDYRLTSGDTSAPSALEAQAIATTFFPGLMSNALLAAIIAGLSLGQTYDRDYTTFVATVDKTGGLGVATGVFLALFLWHILNWLTIRRCEPTGCLKGGARAFFQPAERPAIGLLADDRSSRVARRGAAESLLAASAAVGGEAVVSVAGDGNGATYGTAKETDPNRAALFAKRGP